MEYEEKQKLETNIETGRTIIYDYLVKNPAVAIAAISGMVAICSFAVSYSNYLTDSSMLQYWGWSMTEINWNNRPAYSIIIAFIYNIGAMILQIVVNRSFETYEPLFNMAWKLKARIKSEEKKNRYYKKAIAKVKKTSSIKHEETDRDHLHLLRREIRRIWADLITNWIMEFLIGIILMFMVALLLLSGIKELPFVVKLAISSFVIVLWVAFVVFSKLLIVRKNCLKKYKNDSEKSKEDEEENEYIEARLKKAEDEKRLFCFRDSEIKTFLCSVLLFFAFYTVLISALTRLSPRFKKDFLLYEDDQGQYVITYQNEGNAYLNKAEIHAEEIVIHTNLKRIVKNDSLIYKEQVFKTVKRQGE